MDRLKAIGNAVVPQIPEMIGYAILEANKKRVPENPVKTGTRSKPVKEEKPACAD